VVTGDPGLREGGGVIAAGAPGSGAGAGSGPELTAFQTKVARLFFTLPESRGFLLAGGAALLAQHLTTRPTEDLDFFTAPERGHVPAARDALEAAARDLGWRTERIHEGDTFSRLVIRSDDAGVLVDLAVNAPPDLPASVTAAGPTLAPEELAGHKLLALYDRAAARDFADVYVLVLRFGKRALLARASQIDAGFDAKVLADMIATLDRFTDSEIPRPSCGRSTRPGARNCRRKPGSAGRHAATVPVDWHAYRKTLIW
jgi:hypothetical protein